MAQSEEEQTVLKNC